MNKGVYKVILGFLFLGFAVVLGIQGQYTVAMVSCAVAGYFFCKDFLFKETDLGDSSVPMPSPQEIKKYRVEHPGTSISEAIRALRDKPAS